MADSTEWNPMFRQHSQRAPITDILIWGECFAAMAAVLSRKYPSKSSELFAYQCRIFHVARKYEGQNWVTYNQVYRRQAASRRSLDWAQEDQALYNEAFGGGGRQAEREQVFFSSMSPLTHMQFMQRPSPGVVAPGSPSRSLPTLGPTHLTGWQCG